ncbi:Serine/threonine-protein kinase sik2 [Sarracenia purpurea var. burkii]
MIQQRQRTSQKKPAHTPVFQHSSLNNPNFDAISGYRRLSGDSRHSYIQESTKDINALHDISLNSNSLFQTSPCSALEAISGNESRHKSPACYVHVINQQTIINNIAPLLNFSSNSYSKEHLPLSQLPLMSSSLTSQNYQPVNISSASHSPQNSVLNTINNELLQQYQDTHISPLNSSPSSLSAHSFKMTSPTVGQYGTSQYSTSPNYSLVNSQFSSIINEMENLSETDTGFHTNSYSDSASNAFKYSDISDYSTESSRFSYPDSTAGIIAQYSNSTDEGVEADIEESYQCQRLSYASSSSSSGVGAQNTSFSQNESCSSFHALTNQSSFENYKDKIKMDVTSSLPSCAATSAYNVANVKTKKRKTPSVCPSSWRRYSPLVQNQSTIYQFSRSGMKSPSDFREGRRASDGLVTQHEAKSKNIETSSLKESTSKDAIFNPEYFNLTDKAKGFLEFHELHKEHYDLKSLYDNILNQEDDILQRQLLSLSYKPQHENKFKYPSPRSPTYIRQSPYQESYTKSYDAVERDSVFLDSAPSSISTCKSPTKMHQKWQQNSPKQAFSPIKPAIHHNEMSPSRNRRKIFRQFKHKPHIPTGPSLQSYSDDIPTIIEDSSNGYLKNDDLVASQWQQTLPSTSSSSQSETSPHITWSSSIQESDSFQFLIKFLVFVV